MSPLPSTPSPTDSPPAALSSFQDVAIVGLGLIGGSLALALRRAGFRGRITCVSSPQTLQEAAARGILDAGAPYEDLVKAVSSCDLVVLASPISAILRHIEELGAHGGALREGCVLTDVGSTKRVIVEAARRHLPTSVSFIGGHPLAGAERRGLGAADPFLFQNAFYVLTPGPEVQPGRVAALGGLLGLTGARVLLLSAGDHDRVAATISHLPQLLAVSLVRFLDDLGPLRDQGVRLAAGGFRDMTRIASSPYSVWKDIIDTNRDVVGELLERFLASTGQSLGPLDPEALATSFESAAQTRGAIPRDTKGFLRALWDVLVVVEDRPGIIAGIAGPLAERGLNIKDIEVLKVREDEGGTLRLAFDTKEHAARAIEELRARGFQARLRD